ncbi:DUF61 family protein [Thermococcus sp.]|uniref:DUF61 family protein n=1 Tax=Thermococcus sp. TaxID=35749 RepID=UPI002622F17B|nr:DUF61 family protein [Thermococcus sp.]
MRRAEDILNREFARINVHLPRVRPTLRALLETVDPKVVLRDGSEHHFKRSELEFIASLLGGEGLDALRIPIVLEISSTYRGYFRVRGRVEVEVIDRILGNYDILEDKTEEFYPRYLLPRIRRLLPTTTTYAFIPE